MALTAFQVNLETGQLAESAIARWLRRRGWHVLPAYEKEIDNGKGPRLFMAEGTGVSELITPDLLALKDGRFHWVEAKHKSTFTWYGIGGYWTTGIDLRHWRDYQRVQTETGVPVYLFFLHRESRTRPDDISKWGAPEECPTGLFAGSVSRLAAECSHESANWGRSGMIYWQPFTHLRHVASLEEMGGPDLFVVPAA